MKFPHCGPYELYTRSPEFYFLTGNVTLISGRFAFRVHVEKIVNKSPLLQLLHDKSERSLAPVYFDKCLVIKVLDNPEDLKRLLAVMYRPDICIYFFNYANGMDLLTLMKTSFVYGLKDIFNRCHQRLTYFFPTRLDEWDQCSVYENRPNPYFVIKLNRQINKTIFLPAAFYYLTTAFPPLHSAIDKMSPSDVASYLDMKRRLADKCLKFLSDETKPSRTCGKSTCPQVWYYFHQGFKTRMQFPPYGCINDPLYELLHYIAEINRIPGLCKFDRDWAVSRARRERREMWAELPKFLGFNSWQDAKNVDLDFKIGYQYEMVYPDTNPMEVFQSKNVESGVKGRGGRTQIRSTSSLK